MRTELEVDVVLTPHEIGEMVKNWIPITERLPEEDGDYEEGK